MLEEGTAWSILQGDLQGYKGARSGNAKSMQTVLKHPEHYHVLHALKVGGYNVGHRGPLLTLPFYMAFLLTEV